MEQVTPYGSSRAYWDSHARLYDWSLRILGTPFPRLLELAFGAVTRSDNVLEVAAGTGVLTLPLSRAVRRVTATDYADSMVALLARRVAEANATNVRCESADLYTLPYASRSFDVVIAANVLHLVPDLDGALASLRRVLRPGGLLIVPTFCHGQTVKSRTLSRFLALTGFPAQRRFTRSSYCDALRSRDVHIEKSELLPGLIPIMYVHGRFPV